MGERSLTECSLEVMRELRDDTRETVLLGTLSDWEGIIIEQVAGKHHFRFAIDVGIRFQLHTAAPGKAMLAALPEAELKPILEKMPFQRFNSRTITDRDAFLVELERTRTCGYGVDEAEENEGAHCVGAAILNHQKQPAGAIWITGPSSRLPASDFNRVGLRVREAARQISSKLGYYAD
jgi:DNA-binding IclR family transcriptional regulator